MNIKPIITKYLKNNVINKRDLSQMISEIENEFLIYKVTYRDFLKNNVKKDLKKLIKKYY